MARDYQPIRRHSTRLSRAHDDLEATAGLEAEASEVHLASDDYPEMGDILRERPDPGARVTVVGSLRKHAAATYGRPDDARDDDYNGGPQDAGVYWAEPAQQQWRDENLGPQEEAPPPPWAPAMMEAELPAPLARLAQIEEAAALVGPGSDHLYRHAAGDWDDAWSAPTGHLPYSAPPRSHDDLLSHLWLDHNEAWGEKSNHPPHALHANMHYLPSYEPDHQHDIPGEQGWRDPVFGTRQGGARHRATTINGTQIDGHGDAPAHGTVPRASAPDSYDDRSTEGYGDPKWSKTVSGEDKEDANGATVGMYPEGISSGNGPCLPIGAYVARQIEGRVPWTGAERGTLHRWQAAPTGTWGDFVPSSEFTSGGARQGPEAEREREEERASELRSEGSDRWSGRWRAPFDAGDPSWHGIIDYHDPEAAAGDMPELSKGEGERPWDPGGYSYGVATPEDHDDIIGYEHPGMFGHTLSHVAAFGPDPAEEARMRDHLLRHHGWTAENADRVEARGDRLSHMHDTLHQMGMANHAHQDPAEEARQRELSDRFGDPYRADTRRGHPGQGGTRLEDPGDAIANSAPRDWEAVRDRMPLSAWSMRRQAVSDERWRAFLMRQHGLSAEQLDQAQAAGASWPLLHQHMSRMRADRERRRQESVGTMFGEDLGEVFRRKVPERANLARPEHGGHYQPGDPSAAIIGSEEARPEYPDETMQRSPASFQRMMSALDLPHPHDDDSPLDAGPSEGDDGYPGPHDDSQSPFTASLGGAAGQVIAQLEEDYPPDALAWLRHARVSGPRYVPLRDIDWSDRHTWTSYRQPRRVAGFLDTMTRKAAKGERLKPALVVATPGRAFIGDGHHRGLAQLLAAGEGRSPAGVWAYVAAVSRTEGPWDTMHGRQLRAPSRDDDSTARVPGPDAPPGEVADFQGRVDQAVSGLDEHYGTDNSLDDGDVPPDNSPDAPDNTGNPQATGPELSGARPGSSGDVREWPLAGAAVSETGPAKTQGSGDGKVRRQRKAHLAALVAATASPGFRFEFTASWPDVVAKAKRIRREGHVRITHASRGMVIGEVRGDHDTYESGIQRPPGKPQTIQHWACGCPWASFHQDKSLGTRYAGRPCSHVMALQFEAQARGMFGKEVARDEQAPWWSRRDVVVKSWPPYEGEPHAGRWSEYWLAPSASLRATAGPHDHPQDDPQVECYYRHDGPCPGPAMERTAESLRHPRPAGFRSEIKPNPAFEPGSYTSTEAASHVLTGYLGSQAVGRIHFEASDDGQAYHVNMMHTYPGAAGEHKGIGSAMMDDLYSHVKRNGQWLDHGWRQPAGNNWWATYREPYPEVNTHHAHPDEGWKEYFSPHQVASDAAENFATSGGRGMHTRLTWRPGSYPDDEREDKWTHVKGLQPPAQQATAALIAAGEDPGEIAALALLAGIRAMRVTADQANAPWGSENVSHHPPQKPYGATEPPNKGQSPASYGFLSAPDPENWGSISDNSYVTSPLSNEASRSHCLVPGTRILTRDLRWQPIELLGPGDEVVAFDESQQAGCRGRRFRTATVEESRAIAQPCIRITLDDGSVVTASRDHRWLVESGRNTRWTTTSRLHPGKRIFSLGTWEEEDGKEAGWLAGMYDGEGWVTGGRYPNGNWFVGVSQNEGPTADNLRRALKARGFEVEDYDYAERPRRQDNRRIHIRGGLPEQLRLLGTIRPERLVAKASRLWDDRQVSHIKVATVIAVEPVGELEVIALKTSHGTFIAEGLLSHNCDLPHGRGRARVAAAQESDDDSTCHDCGGITTHGQWAPGKLYENYRVHDHVWQQSGMDKGHLCVGCLENRLGRRLNKHDFPDVPVNSLSPEWDRYAWSDRTPRLRDRLVSEATLQSPLSNQAHKVLVPGAPQPMPPHLSYPDMSGWHEDQESFGYTDRASAAGPSTSLTPRDPGGIRMEESRKDCPCCGGTGEHDTGRECYGCDASGSADGYSGNVPCDGTKPYGTDSQGHQVELDPMDGWQHLDGSVSHDDGSAVTDQPVTPDDGEGERARLGIDGTAGDAQDVPHKFADGGMRGCEACGLDHSAAVHQRTAAGTPFPYHGQIPQLDGALAELRDEPEPALPSTTGDDIEATAAADGTIGGGDAAGAGDDQSPSATAGLGEFGASSVASADVQNRPVASGSVRDQFRARFGGTPMGDLARETFPQAQEPSVATQQPGMGSFDEPLMPGDQSIQTIGNQQWSGGGADSDEVAVPAGEPQGSIDDIVAAFQRSAAASQFGGPGASRGGGQYGDGDIAAAAREHLSKTADVLPDAEAAELIAEGRGQRARNLGLLRLQGTHYEDLGDERGDEVEDDLVWA